MVRSMARRRLPRNSALDVEFEWEPSEDECHIIGFTRHIECYRENYGADADGNRGMMMTVVEDEDQTDITLNGERDRSQWAKPEVEVLTALEKYLKDYTPDDALAGYDEWEPDCDDRGD